MIYASHSFGKRKEKEAGSWFCGLGLISAQLSGQGGKWSRAGGTGQDGLLAEACSLLLAFLGLGLALGSAQRPGSGCVGARPAAGARRGQWSVGWVLVDLVHPLSPLLRSTAHRVQPGGSLPLFSPCSPLPRRRWAARRSGDRLPRAAPPSFHSRQRTGFLLRRTTSRGALLYLTLQTAAKRGALRRGGAVHGRRAAVPRLRLSRAFF